VIYKHFMVGRIFSCTITGLNVQTVEVQADVSNGLPYFSIVGLGDTSVQEAKERVHSGIKNSGFTFPYTRKIINLAPAHIRKQGALFDLPIAISILIATGEINGDKLNDSIIIGELSLTGKVKDINGVLPLTQYAMEQGFKKIFLPKENAKEAGFITGIDIYPIKELSEIVRFCKGDKTAIQTVKHRKIKTGTLGNFTKMSKVFGHEVAKRGLAISATGGHHTLLFGSPGCGKTLLSRAYTDLMPTMNEQEVLETTKIYSITGKLTRHSPIITKRPFREVHHTASRIAIVGGGTKANPGEISLAHNGVLFLDEIAEFDRRVLETLRQPLEDKYININRVNYAVRFPCKFTLIATMNPCPCGYLGDRKRACTCTEKQIKNYQKKLSGPLLDRLDIFLEIRRVHMQNAFIKEDSSDGLEIKKQIENAVKIQRERFKNLKINQNSEMDLSEIKRFCELTKSAKKLLKSANNQMNLSNRSYLKILKVARTIADMSSLDEIDESSIAEAIQFRQKI